MKNLFLIFSLFIFFSSCKDNEGEVVYYDTYIEGNVTDYFTGKPIVGLVMDVEYNDFTFGMEFFNSSSARETVKGASITDMNGYYKIYIAKKIGIGGNNYSTVENMIIKPRNIFDDYHFEEGGFHVNYNNNNTNVFHITNHRFDIRAKSRDQFGFLKIYYNPNDSISYTINDFDNSFTEPYYYEVFTVDTIIGDDYNYFLVHVPLCKDKRVNVWKNIHDMQSFYYTLENKHDTFSIYVQ